MFPSPFQIDLNGMIQHGLLMLNEDIQKYPSIDQVMEYSEKNHYINRANQHGLFLLRSGFHWAAEVYYDVLLSEILKYQKTTNRIFNKGIVYANLAVAEIRGGKIDIGIAHLLRAEAEDRPVDPEFKILETILWDQFESRIREYLLSLNALSKDVFEIDERFLRSFLGGIKFVEDRIFLSGTLLSIEYNRWAMSGETNSYSLGRFYSGLKDICLLTESLLRKHQYPNGTSGKNILLPPLLEGAVGDQLFNKKLVQDKKLASAPDLATFLRKLEDFAQVTPVERSWLYYLALIRNFTGHHFDISDTAQSPSGKTFFPDLYEIALQNVLLAFLYLKNIGAF
jgi:hypothetical protein